MGRAGRPEPAAFRDRVAMVPPHLLAAAATDPIGRHLAVVGAGAERFDGHHVVERPSGAPLVIVCATTGGSGWVRLDGITHAAPAGSVFVLPANVPHGYGSVDLPWAIRWFDFVGGDAGDLIEATGATRSDPVLFLRDAERFAASVEEILRSLETDGSPARAVEAAGAAWRLLSRLAADRLLPARGEPLEVAMHWIAEHADEDLSVADVASAAGLSPSRLLARFRATTGGGVIRYQTGLRMDKARRMLDSSTAHVGEIARAVGYTDPYYFSRVFRRIHGMSPTDFRRRSLP